MWERVDVRASELVRPSAVTARRAVTRGVRPRAVGLRGGYGEKMAGRWWAYGIGRDLRERDATDRAHMPRESGAKVPLFPLLFFLLENHIYIFFFFLELGRW